MTQEEITRRLQEIAKTSLQELGDDAVLAILNERKTLLVDLARLEEEQKKKDEEEARIQQEEARKQAEAKAKEQEEKRDTLIGRLAEINKSIKPDQGDDELLSLIQERKILEAELKVFNTDVPPPKVSVQTVPEGVTPKPQKIEKKEIAVLEEKKSEIKVEEVPQEETVISDSKITINTQTEYNASSHVSPGGKISEIESSDERIVLDSSLQTSEYQGYLSELKANLNSLGTFLQGLPIDVKRNRAFMLEVAKIDPAYAMHYADKDTLKKDETFNIAIAGLNNQRNTGNPLSEMLPEMRTGSVLLAGVKNDFKNIRFARPEMPEYEEILALAQKGALEAVASLKNAHDIQFLLPPILQKDKAFMKEVEKLVSQTT